MEKRSIGVTLFCFIGIIEAVLSLVYGLIGTDILEMVVSVVLVVVFVMLLKLKNWARILLILNSFVIIARGIKVPVGQVFNGTFDKYIKLVVIGDNSVNRWILNLIYVLPSLFAICFIIFFLNSQVKKQFQ